MKRLLFLGDTHIGSTVALCKPTVDLDDGGTYHASRAQRVLYSAWHKLIDLVNPDTTVILNGDLVETDTKHRSYQIITRNRTTLRRLANDVLDELVSKCAAVYVIRGTEAHAGKSASMDDAIGEDFDAPGHTAGSHSFWYLPLEVEGIRFDIAHHASMSGLPWNKHSASILASKIMFSAADRGERVPDVVVRSHMHRWSDSYDAFKTRAIQLPAWTFATAHTERVNPGAIADIGAAFITVERGAYEVNKFKAEPEKRIWVKA